MALLKLDKENMTNLILAFGFTLTILNLWDKIVPPKKDETLKNNSEIIIELLKKIEKNCDNQNLLKEIKEYEEIK